jgi:hypothetical protein
MSPMFAIFKFFADSKNTPKQGRIKPDRKNKSQIFHQNSPAFISALSF